MNISVCFVVCPFLLFYQFFYHSVALLVLFALQFDKLTRSSAFLSYFAKTLNIRLISHCLLPRYPC